MVDLGNFGDAATLKQMRRFGTLLVTVKDDMEDAAAERYRRGGAIDEGLLQPLFIAYLPRDGYESPVGAFAVVDQRID